MENTKEMSLEELQKVAGGDKYDELYDELCEFDDFVSNMKRFALIARRLGRSYEDDLHLTIYGWGDEVPQEEIEAFVRSIYGK